MTEEELKELNNTNRAEEMIILVEGLVVFGGFGGFNFGGKGGGGANFEFEEMFQHFN